MDDDKACATQFTPPLWRQRRVFVLEQLRKHKVSSVLDYGCGEASILAFLIPSNNEECPITRLAGVDICQETLKEALTRCQPWEADFRDLRTDPLVIDIYQGSVDNPDQRLCGYDAIVCSEVIEHLFPHVLDKFFDVVFGCYKPRLLIVTTPNSEYNVNFPSLCYGQPNATFRHDDHKFEWTRREFQDWCESGAKMYGYQTEYFGIGLMDGRPFNLSEGHCTQACIFTRTVDLKPVQQLGKPHKLLQHIEFPFYNEPPLPESVIFQELEKYVQIFCETEYQEEPQQHINNNHETTTMEWSTEWPDDHVLSSYCSQPIPPQQKLITKVPQHIPISSLWDILRIRQICRKQRRMLDILALDHTSYQIGGDTLVVHKAFEITLENPDDSVSSVSSCDDE